MKIFTFYCLVCSGIEKITEQETAHPSLHQLSQLTGAAVAANNGAMENITVSHEIEERAANLILAEEDEDESNSEEIEKESIDQGAFQSEPVMVEIADAQLTVIYSYA